MKKAHKRILAGIIAAALATTTLGLTACGGNGANGVTVRYDLNHNEEVREIAVPSGTKISDWKPIINGYVVEGWYTDPDCTKPYDFGKGVDGNTTLYAKWVVAPKNLEVTFDYNYAGSALPVKVAVKQNKTVAEEKIPEPSRLGMIFDGWYTEPDGGDKWEKTSAVTQTTTLYAHYSYDASVPRDNEGKPIFNAEGQPTVVSFVKGVEWGPGAKIPQIIEKFNKEYEGKIQVNYDNWDNNQHTHSLRFQQTHDTNNSTGNYYTIADVYGLAGIEFDDSAWYEGVSRDAHVKEELKTIPFASNVPFIIYNKTLLGEKNLPQSYSELTALLGELKTNERYGIVANADNWTFQKGTADVAFMQNDSDYYTYDAETDHYVNRWTDSDNNWNNAKNAITSMYGLFGKNGGYGSFIESKSNDDGIVDAVVNGNAVMGIISPPDSITKVLKNNSTLGVMPLSGLFTDENTLNKNAIPVNTIGMQFYKSSSVTNTQLAAAAVFAEYMSKNSAEVGETGWYPLRKSAVESDAFQYSENANIKLLREIGEPENFRTLPGNIVTGWSWVYTFNNYVKPILQSDGTDLEKQLRRMLNLMGERLY